jgi:hypothetical protein
VQKDLHDLGAVAVQVLLKIDDGLVALFPDGVLVDQLVG